MGSVSQSKIKAESVPPPGVGERRAVCRYAVLRDDAWLGWWQAGAFRTTKAKILDISLRGVFLSVDRFPAKGQAVYFCPSDLHTGEEWFEARVVATQKRLFGPRELRLAFRKVFPYEFFKAVVYSRDADVSEPPAYWVPENGDEAKFW